MIFPEARQEKDCLLKGACLLRNLAADPVSCLFLLSTSTPHAPVTAGSLPQWLCSSYASSSDVTLYGWYSFCDAKVCDRT